MPEYTLTARPALGGFTESFDGAHLEEATGLAIASLAIPKGGLTKLKTALKSAYGTAFPAPGKSTLSKNGKIRILGMNNEQAFAIFDHDGTNAADIIGKKLKRTVYVTLQSDNWVGLRLSGALARTALERMCPLDLHKDIFKKGQVARTVMEHLGVIILRESDDGFLLLSASSSAGSFVHALKTSIENAT